MKRISALDPKLALQAFATLFVAAAIALTAVAPADAQRNRNNDQEEEDNVDRTFSTRIGQQVQEVVELQDEEQYAQMIQRLTPLLQEELSPYERQVILQLRATAHFNTDQLQRAIQDFLGAINTGTMQAEERRTTRINVGQLYMATDQLSRGIEQFEIALREGAELTPRLAKMLAQAYAQAERFQSGLRYAEQFYEATPDSEKTSGDFSLMQYYYNQLDRPADELRVVRAQVNRFPEMRQAWQNLVSLFARTGREADAFEANKLMYLNGLFEEEDELTRLAQYYSFYDNPYRGATILEREINAGRVNANVENLELLANMWRQASEFDNAIPVLERLYNVTNRGDDALKLAEALYEQNRPEEAEQWFTTAVNRGGLDEPGDAWTLLGNVRYELGNRQGSLEAFRRGAQFPESRRTANQWIQFVNSQIEGEQRRAVRREQVLIDECRLTLEAERQLLVLTGEIAEDGRVRFESIPQRCQPYFNQFGEQIREAGQQSAQAEGSEAQAG